MKIVRESLLEFHQTGDPLKSLKLGINSFPSEIYTEDDQLLYMDWPNMKGSTQFDLDSWDSISRAINDINLWINGQNDIIGESIDIALEEYGFKIIYGRKNMEIEDGGSIWGIDFKVEPI